MRDLWDENEVEPNQNIWPAASQPQPGLRVAIFGKEEASYILSSQRTVVQLTIFFNTFDGYFIGYRKLARSVKSIYEAAYQAGRTLGTPTRIIDNPIPGKDYTTDVSPQQRRLSVCCFVPIADVHTFKGTSLQLLRAKSNEIKLLGGISSLLYDFYYKVSVIQDKTQFKLVPSIATQQD